MDMDALNKTVRARREPLGLNVRFLRDDGTPDEFSFRDTVQADKFRARLRSQNINLKLRANCALGRDIEPCQPVKQ